MQYNFVTDGDRFTSLPKFSGLGLLRLLDKMYAPVALEIGSEHGITSYHMLEHIKDLTLHCVDPYTGYIDWEGSDKNDGDRQNALETWKNVTARFGDRVILHRKTSDDAVTDFEDNFFDLIFIDGLHTYEQVQKDCENYYSKVKSGGVFSGHDYNLISGVNRAVKEFAAKNNIDTIHETECDVWYWIKP